MYCKTKILAQIVKFIITGSVATLCHFSLAMLLTESLNIGIVPANFVAMTIAFIITYLGNNKWSFNSNLNLENFLKSILLVLINTSIILVTTELALSHNLTNLYTNLSICIFIGIFSFIIHKAWIYN